MPDLSIELEGVPISTEIPLPASEQFSVGREGDIRLIGDQAVARRHLVLHRQGNALIAADQSGGRSRVNDRTFDKHELVLGDTLQICRFRLEYRGTFLRWTQGNGAPIRALNLVREVPDRSKTGQTLRILNGATLQAEGGQFIGLLGPSGSGKTTLLKAISGLCPANSGTITIDDKDLRSNAASLSSIIGYVPQDDVVHDELTVEQALFFSARLRLPGGIADSEIRKLIASICHDLKLTEHLHKRIRESSGGGLSGGQRKRVSVAVELLSSPRVIFLDEPTSGLDPATEAQLMGMLRGLANRGCTVVCTTHVVENAYLMDNLVVVVYGETVFTGNEQEAKARFKVHNLTAMYVELEKLAKEIRESKQAQAGTSPQQGAFTLKIANFVRKLRSAFTEDLPMLVSQTKRHTAGIPASLREIKSGTASVFGGFLKRIPATRVLLSRRLAILTAEWKSIMLLFLQPLIIGLAVAYFVPQVEVKLFFMHLSVLWLGSNNAAQEIVKEIGIYRRERFVGLSIASYLASKFIFGLAITLFQAAVIYGCISSIGDGIEMGTSVGLVVASIFMTTLAANAIGLLISSCAKTPEIALFVVPLFLIPQILFSGGVVTLDNWKDKPVLKSFAAWMPANASQRIMDVARFYKNAPRYTMDRDARLQVIEQRPLSYLNLQEEYDLYPPDLELTTLRPAWIAGARLSTLTVVGLVGCWLALRVRERE